MATKKATSTEDVTVEFNGVTHQGYRVVQGTKRMTQHIYYHGRSKFDGRGYHPGQQDYMRIMAEVILRELVEETPK